MTEGTPLGGVTLGIDLALGFGEWGARFVDDVALDLMPEGTTLPRIERVSCLPGGMQSGAPSFAVAIRLTDGRVLFAETSWQAMALAVHALEQRHPVPLS